MNKLTREFYTRNVLEVSQDLLGKLLVYENNGRRIIGRIVEVEAYMGPNDKAAHSYGGKVTERTKVMYKEGGYVYIFMIYGMYYCV
jgi:3-methyladenine DNA glycosylase